MRRSPLYSQVCAFCQVRGEWLFISFSDCFVLNFLSSLWKYQAPWPLPGALCTNHGGLRPPFQPPDSALAPLPWFMPCGTILPMCGTILPMCVFFAAVGLAATREGPWTRCSRCLFYWGFEFHCKMSQGEEPLTSERSPFSQHPERMKPHVHGRSGGDSGGCETTRQFQLTTVVRGVAAVTRLPVYSR